MSLPRPHSCPSAAASPRGHTSRSSRWILAATALLFAATAADARHQEPLREAPAAQERRALIIDDQLIARPVVILSLDERLLTFSDDQQRRRTLARSSLLALIPEHPPESPPRRRQAATTVPGMLELTDGQRLPGDLRPSQSGEGRLAWSHSVFGEVDFALERVASFWRPGAAFPERRRGDEPTPALTSDIVFLANGDRLSGYLASLAVPIRVETSTSVVELSHDRLAGALLSNPREPAEGLWIWLSDGTEARIADLTFDVVTGRVTIVIPTGQAVSVAWPSIRAVSFDAAGLIPLARLAHQPPQPPPDRYYAPPVRRLGPAVDDPFRIRASPLGADDLLLSGPMSVAWALPPGARRLAFGASLAEGAAPWGDCDLVILLDGQEVARRRLTPQPSPLPISVPAAGRTLTITIEPGRFGPIRDWVVLGRALILVDPPR